MSETPILDTKVLAQTYRDQPPPYECPVCHKSYRSLAGILYHVGQFRSVTGIPRCQLGEVTPRRSPARTPGSPMSARRRAPKREALTWAESQRLVEVEFQNEYRRIEIDRDISLLDEYDQDQEEAVSDCESNRKAVLCKTPLKRTRADTPRGCKAQASSSKNKNKRRSKLKNQSQDAINSAPTLPVADFEALEITEFPEAPQRDAVYYRFVDQSAEELDELVEYDMDEEDHQWLVLINEERKNEGHTSVPQEAFELLLDRLEKECVFESHVAGPGNDANPYNIDENAVCCICNDGECHNTNAILFCDMCNLAVHQECYGVPYIPEGQWLCRRCLQSPSCSVDCVLCPNKGGAFKQTLDGRWAHVICALWIPEVQFANTVFLEPIDGIHDVPAARWKLMCYICRKRMGACIQCAKANCYTAFHVTCSQQAHLYMKIEIVKGGEVRKTAYCDCHTPLSARKKLMESLDAEESEDSASEKEEESHEVVSANGEGTKDGEVGGVDGEGEGKKTKSESKVVKRARKLLEEQQVAQAPVVNLPYVPQTRLNGIINRVSLHKKSQFIPKLVSYWKLKRQSRNGVPLLRRLQAINKNQKQAVTTNLTEEEKTALTEQLSLWQGLRRDLEKARLLVELVRKREKLKREQLRMWEEITRLRLTPLNIVMKRVLVKTAAKDPANIFAEPVCTEEVPDYLDVIKHPMDLSTMRQKVEAHQYNSMREFERDLTLVWNNAMVYNQKDTIYYRAAVRIKEAEQNLAAYIHEIDAGRPWQLADYKGPDLSSIDYSKILDIFKEKND